MKLLVPLVMTIAITAVNAQKPPPKPVRPPPPAIFSTPKTSEITTFRSQVDKFSIDFAGHVSQTSEEIGRFAVRNYSAGRVGTRATVVAYDFPAKVNREMFLEDLRNELLRVKGTEIASEKAFDHDGLSAREISIESGYNRETTRVIFVGTKIFRISVDVTNWHILSEKRKAEFHKEKDRFFDSFKTGRQFLAEIESSNKVLNESVPEKGRGENPPVCYDLRKRRAACRNGVVIKHPDVRPEEIAGIS